MNIQQFDTLSAKFIAMKVLNSYNGSYYGRDDHDQERIQTSEGEGSPLRFD